MVQPLALNGQRFGRLTVLERCGTTKWGSCIWKCKCDCGNIVEVPGINLRDGRTNSCGCLRKEMMRDKHMVHGKSRHRNGQKTHPIYNTWMGMKARCFNPNSERYLSYGGRGITVCDEWKDDFQSFYEWSISNGWSEGLTLDRINNNGGYSPNNCRWTNMTVQNNNKRNVRIITYNGKSQTITEWSKELGISKSLLYYRITHWSIEEALTREVKH